MLPARWSLLAWGFRRNSRRRISRLARRLPLRAVRAVLTAYAAEPGPALCVDRLGIKRSPHPGGPFRHALTQLLPLFGGQDVPHPQRHLRNDLGHLPTRIPQTVNGIAGATLVGGGLI